MNCKLCIVTVFALLALTACGDVTGSATAEDAVKIGVMLPLTGDASFWGENALKGIEMAEEEHENVQFIVEDTQCNPKAATKAARKLINVDEVQAIIGDICSSPTLAAAPIAQRAHVPLITPCAEAPEITQTGEYVFRTWTPNDRQAETIAEYVSEELDIQKIAVLAIDNDYGQSLSSAFQRSFERHRGTVALVETYKPEEKSFRTQLTRIQHAGVDTAYLVSYQPDGVRAVRQMNELNMDIQVIGTSGISSEEDFFEPLGALANGIVFADLVDRTDERFKRHFRTAYEQDWPGIGSCLPTTYDTAGLIADGLDTGDLQEYLRTVQYDGVSGNITFDEQGDVT